MNGLLIGVCALAAIGCGLLAEANHDNAGLGGHGAGYDAGYAGYGQHHLGTHGPTYGESYQHHQAGHGQYSGEHHAAGQHYGSGQHHGSGLGYGQGYGHAGYQHGGLAGHSHGAGLGHGTGLGHGAGLGHNSHGHGHGGYAGHHSSSGHQVRALLKNAGRSMLASNPELDRKFQAIAHNPSVRRGMEKVKPKLDAYGRKAKPYLHEGTKLIKEKLAETVNKQNLKQGYQAAEAAGHLHH